MTLCKLRCSLQRGMTPRSTSVEPYSKAALVLPKMVTPANSAKISANPKAGETKKLRKSAIRRIAEELNWLGKARKAL